MSAQLYQTLGEDLLASFNEKRYTDITITTEQGTPNARTFPSHRYILYSRSQYFRELLSDGNDIENIELPDISGEIFEDLLSYFYSGKVNLGHRSGSEVLDLLLGAEKLALDLVNSIQSFIIEQHGYNPIEWKRVDCVWGKTPDSFIFSFPSNDFQDAILSRVNIVSKAVSWELEYGPSFGNDLIMIGPNLQKRCLCNVSNLPQVYERKLRNSSNEFEIVDYEVYQIRRKV
ncbi:serine-enriched protein [Gigaspora margarita]|uniref:Serine-enriched protein n=1 Tax=Gigaspora margarita TaxID=4874 RepID=A0A8H4AIS8_GIGMA|nr:serine-enriched protein [Gigaspora margarita]